METKVDDLSNTPEEARATYVALLDTLTGTNPFSLKKTLLSV